MPISTLLTNLGARVRPEHPPSVGDLGLGRPSNQGANFEPSHEFVKFGKATSRPDTEKWIEGSGGACRVGKVGVCKGK